MYGVFVLLAARTNGGRRSALSVRAHNELPLREDKIQMSCMLQTIKQQVPAYGQSFSGKLPCFEAGRERDKLPVHEVTITYLPILYSSLLTILLLMHAFKDVMHK